MPRLAEIFTIFEQDSKDGLIKRKCGAKVIEAQEHEAIVHSQDILVQRYGYNLLALLPPQLLRGKRELWWFHSLPLSDLEPPYTYTIEFVEKVREVEDGWEEDENPSS
jgi:hypothetical protein